MVAAILPQFAQAADPDLSEYTLVKTLDFTTATYTSDTDITLNSGSQQGTAYDPGNKLQQKIYDVTTPDELTGSLAFQATYVNGKGKGWWIRSTKGGLYCISAGRSAAVLGLKKDYVVKFTCSTDASTVLSLTNANSEPDGPFTYEASEDGKSYFCTMTADGQLGFFGNKNKGYITSIAIYAPGKVVIKPTGRYTAVDGVKRTVTFTGTGLAWNTDGGDSYTATGQDEWAVTVDKNTTYYVVSTNGTEKSEPLVFNVEAGEELSLAQPIVTMTAIAPGFTKTYSVTCDNSNVLLNPAATIRYAFEGSDGSTEEQVAAGGVINATASGTYYIYAEAEGYKSTMATIDNTKELELTKTIDFTALTADDLSANWKLLNAQTGVPGSSSQWPAYFGSVVTDEYFYDYTAESASATDVIPGLSVEFTESGKTPKLYTGFGLMYPVYQLNADGSDASGANTSGNITVADGTADQYAVYTYINNYSKGGTKTAILAGNENFALYRFSDLLTKVEIYSPKAATVVEVSNIAGIKDIADGTEIKLTLNAAKVTVCKPGMMGTNCYIEDESGAIKLAASFGWLAINPESDDLIGALGITESGVQFDGTLYCTVNNFENELSLSPSENTTNSEVTKTENVTVNPTVLTLAQATEQLDRYNMCYVKFEKSTFVSDDGMLALVKDDAVVNVYDEFGLFYDEDGDPISLDLEKAYDVAGILLNMGEGYGVILEPVSCEVNTATAISAVSAESIANGSVWTLSGMRVSKNSQTVKSLKKGIYVVNGKKIMVK